MSVLLIIMAFAFSGATDGGAHSSLMQIPMPSMAVCEEAAAKVRRDGTAAHAETGWRIGVRSVEAVCVRTAP